MLSDLPSEILLEIISYAPTAQFLHNISRTNHKLHDLVEADGWKVFVLGRFPSIPVPPYWKEAAHALTTLSRNWDRKAFIARDFSPVNTSILCLPTGELRKVGDQWKTGHGQTMGYQPVIDSYEQWTGNTWDSRKEVVIYGAGSELVMGTTEQGRRVNSQWQTAKKEERATNFAPDKSKRTWVSYKENRHWEGRDDITTVNIVRPHQLPKAENGTGETVIVGRAGGDLDLLRLSTGQKNCTIRSYQTKGRNVRAADLTTGQSPLLATCLGNTQAALFRVHDDSTFAKPISEVSCVPEKEMKQCRLWSCKFLGPDKLALGRGIAKRLVYVYGVGQDGLSAEPLRTFGGGIEKETNTSAYPIMPIPASSMCGDMAGNTFFSGGYDGLIRLHDMRSPAEYESLITDPTDYSAIFSLAMVGRERLVAGAAINSLLKIWDLRFAGGRTYHYLDALSTDGTEDTISNTTTIGEAHAGGWNIFASPYDAANRRWQRGRDSPIYSLSRPSNSSTSLYVGRENNVTQVNFTSMLDKHPDPIFKHSIVRRPGGVVDARKTWDSDGKHHVLSLAMYDHVRQEQGHMPLKTQRQAEQLDVAGIFTVPGYDGRWRPVGMKEFRQASGF